MAGKSVGTLNAMLSLSTRDWDAGLSKARRSLEKTRAQIIKSMNVSGEFLGSKQAEMFASFGGGGMSGSRAIRELSMRRARESYMGRGTAEQNSWQSSMSAASAAMRSSEGMLASLARQAERAGKVMAVMGGAMRAAEVSLGLLNRRGKEWDEIFEPMRSAPLGVGLAWSVGWDLGKAIRGVWKGDEAGQAEWEAGLASNAQKEADTGWKQMEYLKSLKKRMANMRAEASFDARMAGVSDADRPLAELRHRHAKQLDDLEEQRKAALGAMGVGTFGERFRAGIESDFIGARNAMLAMQAAEQESMMTKRRDEESAARRQQEWNDRRKLLSMDSEIAQKRLMLSGRVTEAEQEAIKTKYQLELEEAYKTGDREYAARLSMLRDLEIAEVDSKRRAARIADMDYSGRAGTGATEKVRDVLESIDRGIKRGVVARAG